MKEFYTVGEFSEMFGLNVQTLRYYDSIGLFKPNTRNEKNARRNYEFDQVYGLAAIRFLRRMGYSLQDIQNYMSNREPEKTLDILKIRSEELQRQLEDLTNTCNAVTRKISFIEYALREAEKAENGLETFAVRRFNARYYLPIGDEEFLYVDDAFYLYPTIAFYENGLKTFGAYLYGVENPAASNKKSEALPAGSYLCGYHTGPYSTIIHTENALRASHPHLKLSPRTCNFNIIDQFVEKDSQRYITCLQIEIIK